MHVDISSGNVYNFINICQLCDNPFGIGKFSKQIITNKNNDLQSLDLYF